MRPETSPTPDDADLPPDIDPQARTGAYRPGSVDPDEATHIVERPDLPEIPEVQIEREIGRGGMGVVYVGVQTYIDRRVAVKVLSREAGRAPGFLERFQREARILAGLVHPNIVACYQAGSIESGECYLVMEYVEGGNLAGYVGEHGRLDEARALRVTAELLRALEHAHSFGIIHRDVKPDNLLLGPASGAHPSLEFPYVVKLADLGLAKPTTGGDVQLTATGMVVGTPATMSPEQINAPEQVDFRSDIYGAGCVLYFALTGRHAFPGLNFTEIIVQKTRADAPDPAELCPELSPDVCKLVRRMLAPDPEDRPGSYPDLLADVEQLLATRATVKTVGPRPAGARDAPASSKSPGHSKLLAGILVVVVMAGLLGAVISAFLGSHSLPDEPPPVVAPPAAPGPPSDEPPVQEAMSPEIEIPEDPPLSELDQPIEDDGPPEHEPELPARLLGKRFGEELAGWRVEPPESWGPAEEIEGAIQGVGTGVALRELGRPPWEVSGRILPWQDVENAETGEIERRLTLNEAAIVVRMQNAPALALAVSDVGGHTSIGLRRAQRWPVGQLEVAKESKDQVLTSPEAIPFKISVSARVARFLAMGKEVALVRLPARSRVVGIALVVRGQPQYSVRIADLEVGRPRPKR